MKHGIKWLAELYLFSPSGDWNELVWVRSSHYHLQALLRISHFKHKLKMVGEESSVAEPECISSLAFYPPSPFFLNSCSSDHIFNQRTRAIWWWAKMNTITWNLSSPGGITTSQERYRMRQFIPVCFKKRRGRDKWGLLNMFHLFIHNNWMG